MKNFWQKLPKPFFVLAPMADVTDAVFRQIITKYGKPDVVWTEFVSADGLAHDDARPKLLIDLKFSENERPIVAQIFGGKPENIKKAAELCQELGFDGVDINMGCPDKSVEKQCAGAATMRDINLAREIIRAAKEGAPNLPISVKTRIGYNKNEIETWIRDLL
ncbi:tRNA-dihydrouridine synthase family protein, partial [Candidatus Nomurabacteria bacterium]|nr:tRNA-dihydrouridine synthase family protein [Candidatus Nomurabacteria bacterium]